MKVTLTAPGRTPGVPVLSSLSDGETMSFGHFLLMGQVLALLPAMSEGTELRIVSPDLLTVYAKATVQGGRLVFTEFPGPGTEVRIIIFPAESSAADRVDALGARALVGRISPDGRDVLLTEPESLDPLSLRQLLFTERGVRMRFALNGED